MKDLLLFTGILMFSVTACTTGNADNTNNENTTEVTANEEAALITLIKADTDSEKPIALYYTESTNWEELRAALVIELDKYEAEGIEFKGFGQGVYCFNNKEVIAELNSANEALDKQYTPYQVCGLDVMKWGNRRFVYGGAGSKSAGGTGWSKVIFQDNETGEWEPFPDN